MKVLSGSYLRKWKQERDTSQVCVPPMLLWSFLGCFSVCLGDKRLTHSLPVLAAWAATAKQAVDPSDMRAPQSRNGKSLFEILTSCLDFVNAPNPTQPSHTSISTPPPLQLSIRQPAVGQNKPRAQLRRSAWIKDLVTGQHVTAVCIPPSTCACMFGSHRQ